jgi:ABC-2 type transport system permease protein
MQTLANIFWLGTKELRSVMRDFVLLGLVRMYIFQHSSAGRTRAYFICRRAKPTRESPN